MLSPYVRELSVGDMIRGSVRLYSKSFIPLVLCYMIPEMPGGILWVYGLAHNSHYILLLGGLFLSAGGFFAYTGITLCISDACIGNTPSVVRSLARGRSTLGSLALASLLQMLIVFAGTLAFLIPGVIFALWYLYSPIAVVLEGRSGWPALKRSKELAKGFNMRNLGVLMLGALLLVPAFVLGYFLLFIVGFLLSKAGLALDMISVIGGVCGLFLSFILYPLIFVLLVLTYYDLRARKEGYDSMALEAELGR